jgi:hypothetical protein
MCTANEQQRGIQQESRLAHTGLFTDQTLGENQAEKLALRKVDELINHRVSLPGRRLHSHIGNAVSDSADITNIVYQLYQVVLALQGRRLL